jgi:UDP-N-acetyl-2-amino-2-deoxyglucuronate dehydrogenase
MNNPFRASIVTKQEAGTMSEKLRVGVIGCGGIARNHVRGYLECGRYEVVALTDLNTEAMADYEGLFHLGARHYTDAREMLAKENLDVVSIGVWHGGHARWTIVAAAHRPKAILCEKPMADTMQAAEQMLIACQRNGVKLAIGHQRRFLPSYTLAKELIAQGAIGDVQMMVSFGAEGLPNYCSHQTDMFRYFLSDDECEWAMGNIERKTDRWERNTRIEDSAIAVFQFRCGARALILSEVTPHVYQGAHIYGSAGMIELDTTELRLLNADTGGAWQTHRRDGRFVQADDARFEWTEGGAGQADELADWVEGAVETHRGCGESGYKALEMIHAVYESARMHEKVILPLQTRVNPLDLMVESGHLEPIRPGRYDIRAKLLRGERMRSDSEA